MSLTISKLKNRYFEGTACATANDPAANKKRIPPDFKGCTKYVGNINGEQAYLEGGKDWDRTGFNFPNTETELNALTSTSIRNVLLTNSLGVAIYIVSTKLYAIAYAIGNGGALTYGTPVTVNDADTGTRPDICRIDDTTYAIAYADDGGSDYLCVRMGTVDGTTITQGDEKEMTAAAVQKDDGIGICQPRSGVIAVGYGDANGYGTVIAATFSGTTVGTPGTAVSATGTDKVTYCAIASHATGYVTLAYADASTNYLTVNIGTVSAAAVVAFAGSEKALNAQATTEIFISSPRNNSLVITWLDSGDPHIIAGGVVAGALTTFVQGTEASITTTATAPRHACLSATEVALAYCDDAHAGDYGKIVRYSISWATTGAGTLTQDSVIDIFCEASCKSDLAVAATTNGAVVMVYEDIDNSNHLTASYGQYCDDIIDIRSGSASATYSLWLFPVYEYVATN